MKKEDELEKYADIDLFVANKRGGFIHLMIYIESMFEDIIKHHYCKENVRDEFMFSVLTKENFGFSTKYQLVCFILKNHYADFYKKNLKIITGLATLIEDRNNFAHRKFFSANPDNDINQTSSFNFEHYKTSKHKTIIDKTAYNNEIYNNKLKQISLTTHKLIEVYKLIGITDSEILKYLKK